MKLLKVTRTISIKIYNGDFSIYLFFRFILCAPSILYCSSCSKGAEANQCIAINSKLIRLETDYGG